MNKTLYVTFGLLLFWGFQCGQVGAAMMSFDPAAWETGDMNQQAPADSSGDATNSHLDYFYYYERIPMRMPTLGDSLGEGSSSRTYDSAVFTMVVAGQGLYGSDSMLICGKRLTRDWMESGVSWNYFQASTDSVWTTSGGDINSLPCTDTVIIDTSISVYDTLYLHLDTGFVRYMVENNNWGWLMMAENLVDRGTFMVFTENAAAAYRPTLSVYFSDGQETASSSGRRRISHFSRRCKE